MHVIMCNIMYNILFRSSTGHARGRGLMSLLPESEAEKQKEKIIKHQVSS